MWEAGPAVTWVSPRPWWGVGPLVPMLCALWWLPEPDPRSGCTALWTSPPAVCSPVRVRAALGTHLLYCAPALSSHPCDPGPCQPLPVTPRPPVPELPCSPATFPPRAELVPFPGWEPGAPE